MSDKMARLKLAVGGVVVVAVLAYGAWGFYQSPNQVNGRQLKRAAQAQAAGQVVQAAELYAGVAQSGSEVAGEGAAGLRGLIKLELLKTLPPADAGRVLAQAQRARAAGQAPMPPKEVAAVGWALVEAHAPKDAAGAKAVLDAMAAMEADKAKLAAAAEPLLERIVAAQPGNARASIEYAELLDRKRDCTRCEALLAPHAAALGRGEGARILGQIYAAKGKLDESYALLQPYTEEKLKVFVQREADYRKTGDAIEKMAFDALKAGKAPQDFYKRYDAADETTKREMVSTYINEQLSASATLKGHAQALREASAIVPVALDLGIVTVQRAQTLKDAAARNAQFQAAEKVFLSIRGMAGDTDGYRLYLGQVYYWLGKQDEGKKLFDELLATHKRAYNVLLEVGGLLRSVGSVQEARKLMEEAYGKATDNDQRWTAAHYRSVMHVDAEDELMWLERSDRSNGRIRAQIHSTRANMADRKGQRAVAKREYEQAVGEFAKLPEGAATLNSTALVHLALYAMEGDPQHRDQGLAKLDQALALMPTDSTLLLNNISAIRSAAMGAILGDKVDVPMLRSSGDFRLTDYLHDDEATRHQVRGAVRDNAAVKKALAYGEKAALLAPRNPESYAFQATIASLLEDAPAMTAVATRAQASKLDIADIQLQLQKIADGTDMKTRLAEMGAATRELSGLLQQPSVQRQPMAWAVVAGRWVDAQIVLARWGQPIDVEAVVKTARKARATQVSTGTLRTLMDALEARAALRLAKLHPAFASDLAKHGRSIELSVLLGMHIDEDPEFRRQALADADLMEVMSLVRDRDRRYPSKSSVWAWLLFRHADTAYAQVLSTRLRQDETYPAYFQLQKVFEPLSAETAIGRYQYALAVGDRAAAQRLLDEARKAGIALPAIVGRQLKA